MQTIRAEKDALYERVSKEATQRHVQLIIVMILSMGLMFTVFGAVIRIWLPQAAGP